MFEKRKREKSCCERLLAFVFTAGLLVLIYWAIFQPHHIRATVASAALTSLNVSGAAVSYRLAVVLSLYNPSLRVNIYYDELPAELWLGGGAFLCPASGASPAEFYQRRKTSENVTFDFVGSGVGGDAAGELEKGIGQGAVRLEVAVDARVRYRFSTVKIQQKPRIRCSLTVPVKPEGGGGGAVGGALVSGDRCSVKY